MIPVSEWLARALYDPDTGFYETGGRAGRRGASFVTSPETGPLFGAVIARALDRWWRDAGRPSPWTVVDAGAGPGTLARTILAARPECGDALDLVCVERTSAQRERHPDGVRSLATLPDRADVIVANELLDNLLFDIVVETDRGWAPASVDDGDLVADGASVGNRRCAPVVADARSWVLDARRRADRVVTFDYMDTTAALASRPWPAWVRAFADQEQVEDPFVDPGSRDVTVVVPVDQLPEPSSTESQADWLRRHGIDDLVTEGAAYWDAHAAAPDLTAIAMRSRGTEAHALCDPEGLGGFTVCEWRRS